MYVCLSKKKMERLDPTLKEKKSAISIEVVIEVMEVVIIVVVEEE